MNIDPYLLRGLNYFKRDLKAGDYYPRETIDYDAETGAITNSSINYPVQVLLQKYDQSMIGEIVSEQDNLCLVHCVDVFDMNEEDVLISQGVTYEVTNIYRNVSKRVKIINVRKQ